MDKLKLTPEQQLAFDGFIDVMVQTGCISSQKHVNIIFSTNQRAVSSWKKMHCHMPMPTGRNRLMSSDRVGRCAACGGV